MNQFAFTIYGNQENKAGNPVPYVRSTQGSKWNPRYQRYCSWKDYVVKAYLLVAPFKGEANRRMIQGGKPIGKGVSGRVMVNIFFADETHCDPDNVVKGILDTLFQDDKHIDVETYHHCRADRPRVEVQVQLNKNEKLKL